MHKTGKIISFLLWKDYKLIFKEKLIELKPEGGKTSDDENQAMRLLMMCFKKYRSQECRTILNKNKYGSRFFIEIIHNMRTLQLKW